MNYTQATMIFKRKIYSQLLNWKNTAKGTKALLIEGARRIGKSTIVQEFAKNEYKSHILIDFNTASDVVTSAFNNYMTDLDTLFLVLSLEYNVKLHKRESVIIFDEIQQFPKVRQAVKYLVEDGRYDYIETGSLISIKENISNITLPSEERKILMHPMDFEEFAWAMGEDMMIEYIRNCIFVFVTQLALADLQYRQSASDLALVKGKYIPLLRVACDHLLLFGELCQRL